ncbi:hypothetical protein SynNOUM97013_02104 [Synechococcus sp. NOUM97013]|nr:hypothetical protein SynNOUM97013_02104 [Synechococcus sp. NOUM97013]
MGQEQPPIISMCPNSMFSVTTTKKGENPNKEQLKKDEM